MLHNSNQVWFLSYQIKSDKIKRNFFSSMNISFCLYHYLFCWQDQIIYHFIYLFFIYSWQIYNYKKYVSGPYFTLFIRFYYTLDEALYLKACFFVLIILKVPFFFVNLLVYFCSSTTPWRYWVKSRSKEIKREYRTCLPLESKQYNCKLIQLKAYASTYKYDFICLSETFLDSSTPDNLVDIQRYNLVRTGHPDNAIRAGVCIYYKEFLPVRVTSLPHFKEALLLEMSFNKKRC